VKKKRKRGVGPKSYPGQNKRYRFFLNSPAFEAGKKEPKVPIGSERYQGRGGSADKSFEKKRL